MVRIIILEKQKHVTKNQTTKGTDNMGNDKKLNEQTMLSDLQMSTKMMDACVPGIP